LFRARERISEILSEHEQPAVLPPPRHIIRATFGNEEVAARIALRNSLYNEGIGKGFLDELATDLLDALVNGNQIRIAGAFRSEHCLEQAPWAKRQLYSR
jgi:hypothetical protein